MKLLKKELQLQREQTLTPLNLLTPFDVAMLLGVTEGTLEVWRCTKRYPLNYIKIGGRVRYRLEDVDAFVEARVVQCGPGRAKKGGAR